MAKGGKYAGLKGKIQVQDKEQISAEAQAELAPREKFQLPELIAEYNKVETEIRALNAQLKPRGFILRALDVLIRRGLSGQDASSIGMQGFVWGTNVEPYPSADDPAAVKKYFRENGLAELLELTPSELAGRLTKIVKEEAENNELRVVEEVVKDPVTGEEHSVQVTRSKVPGVKVFLAEKLSRNKE